MGQNGTGPRWLRGRTGLSLRTTDCGDTPESRTERPPRVGMYFQAVWGRRQGVCHGLTVCPKILPRRDVFVLDGFKN
jgi:hypothetical protein